MTSRLDGGKIDMTEAYCSAEHNSAASAVPFLHELSILSPLSLRAPYVMYIMYSNNVGALFFSWQRLADLGGRKKVRRGLPCSNLGCLSIFLPSTKKLPPAREKRLRRITLPSRPETMAWRELPCCDAAGLSQKRPPPLLCVLLHTQTAM